MEEIWRKRDFAAFDEIHAPDFVDRSPAGRGSDRTSYRQSIIELYAAFPDWEAIIDDLLVDATTSKVAVRWTATGTHRGEFLGFAPSDKRITFRGIEIVRIGFADCRTVGRVEWRRIIAATRRVITGVK